MFCTIKKIYDKIASVLEAIFDINTDRGKAYYGFQVTFGIKADRRSAAGNRGSCKRI